MRYFIGTQDVSFQFKGLKKSFLSINNIKVLDINTNSSQHYMRGYTIPMNHWNHFVFDRLPIVGKVLRFFIMKFIFMYVLFKCDKFIFFWSSFFPSFNELFIYKIFKKQIAVFFVGSDIRIPNVSNKYLTEFNSLPYKDKIDLNLITKKIKNVSNNADFVFGTPAYMHAYRNPYYHFFVPVDLNLFAGSNKSQRLVPKIIHAPSKESKKGTTQIREIVDKILLNEPNLFEFEILKDIPHNMIIEKYLECDILIGQLNGIYGGKQERELLALNKVVLSSFKRDYAKKATIINGVSDQFIDDCPIIDISKSNLETILIEIVKDVNKRETIAKKGREYVKKYHDIGLIGTELHHLFTNGCSVFFPQYINESN